MPEIKVERTDDADLVKTVMADVESGLGFEFDWTFGDGTKATVRDKPDVEHPFPAAGSYPIYLTMTMRESGSAVHQAKRLFIPPDLARDSAAEEMRYVVKAWKLLISEFGHSVPGGGAPSATGQIVLNELAEVFRITFALGRPRNMMQAVHLFINSELRPPEQWGGININQPDWEAFMRMPTNNPQRIMETLNHIANLSETRRLHEAVTPIGEPRITPTVSAGLRETEVEAVVENPSIGILSYGSLIDNPGEELEPLIVRRFETTTPFNVEFARSSHGRGGAPTLVPVDEGGAQVKAQILVLQEGISLKDAKDMLWRREANRPGRYVPPPPDEVTPNHIFLIEVPDYEGLDVVLYVRIGQNMDPENVNPQHLAELAIESNYPAAVGMKKRDGISYLRETIDNGIITPLTGEYAMEIINKVVDPGPPGWAGEVDLEQAPWPQSVIEDITALLGDSYNRTRVKGEPDPDTDRQAWEDWRDREASMIHPSYHLIFPDIKGSVIQRVKRFIDVDGPWRGTREERIEKYKQLVIDLSAIFDISPAPTCNIVHPQEVSLVGSGIFMPPRTDDRGRVIVGAGGHLALPKGSVVTVLHEFRHGMQHHLNVQQRGIPSPEREEYGPIEGGLHEEDARAWSLSIYYLVDPSRFILGVRRGIIYHLKRVQREEELRTWYREREAETEEERRRRVAEQTSRATARIVRRGAETQRERSLASLRTPPPPHLTDRERLEYIQAQWIRAGSPPYILLDVPPRDQRDLELDYEYVEPSPITPDQMRRAFGLGEGEMTDPFLAPHGQWTFYDREGNEYRLVNTPPSRTGEDWHITIYADVEESAFYEWLLDQLGPTENPLKEGDWFWDLVAMEQDLFGVEWGAEI